MIASKSRLFFIFLGRVDIAKFSPLYTSFFFFYKNKTKAQWANVRKLSLMNKIFHHKLLPSVARILTETTFFTNILVRTTRLKNNKNFLRNMLSFFFLHLKILRNVTLRRHISISLILKCVIHHVPQLYLQINFEFACFFLMKVSLDECLIETDSFKDAWTEFKNIFGKLRIFRMAVKVYL